jgi:hypothetical protein
MYFEKEVPPRVLLIARDGDVQGVRVWQRVGLVDGAPREIEQVSRLQHHVHDGVADLLFVQIATRKPGQLLTRTPRIWNERKKRDGRDQHE